MFHICKMYLFLYTTKMADKDALTLKATYQDGIDDLNFYIFCAKYNPTIWESLVESHLLKRMCNALPSNEVGFRIHGGCVAF